MDSLVREHAVLEGILDRRDARRWRQVQFLVGGAVGFLAQQVLTWLLK
jgi:hypothetical protein